jgi:hemoglobin
MKWLLLLVSLTVSTIARAEDASLFEDLGGREKIATFTADLIGRMKTDRRISHFFKETDMDRLHDRLTDYICHVSGEKRRYRGANQRAAHAGLGIHEADFNALVEDLEASMDDAGIPFSTQARLLALLAPVAHQTIDIPLTPAQPSQDVKP